MDKIYIVKIGGNIIDDEEKLQSFLQSFASVPHRKILVHGGGKLATRMAEAMNIPQQMVEGRRITDAETLRIVTMVYAGYINKNIVARLQSFNCNAMGFTGADGNLIKAHKRTSSSLDYGFAGDVDDVNTEMVEMLLMKGISLVVSPITHDKAGQLLNTNADTISNEMATALAKNFEVILVYCFEKKGVLLDAEDDNTIIPQLNSTAYSRLKEGKKVFAGMIPKLDNAFAALQKGVSKVLIGKAEELQDLIAGRTGTIIKND